jgi:TetR/AcrR family transcriptional regulator
MNNLTRQERKILKVKSEILDSARHFFLSKGYDNVSMDEIADSIPISKTTIYKYFESKEEILHTILSELLSSINMIFDKEADDSKSGFEQMLSMAKEFLRLFSTDRKMQHFFLLERDINSKVYSEKKFEDILDGIGKLLERATDLLKKGIEDKSIKSSIDPVKTGAELSMIVLGFCSMISENKYDIICGQMGLSINDIIDGVMKHILVIIENLKA